MCIRVRIHKNTSVGARLRDLHVAADTHSYTCTFKRAKWRTLYWTNIPKSTHMYVSVSCCSSSAWKIEKVWRRHLKYTARTRKESCLEALQMCRSSCVYPHKWPHHRNCISVKRTWSTANFSKSSDCITLLWNRKRPEAHRRKICITRTDY